MYDILILNTRKTKEKYKYSPKKCTFYRTPQPQRHKNHAAETSHTQYTAYRKHQCHQYDAPTSPPLILDFSQWTCFCESHCDYVPLLCFVWQE